MHRSVDDIIDVAVGVLITAILLYMGVWCWRYLLDLYHQPVVEKTAPTVLLQARAPEYVYTGKDCLLELVVNDTFCPEPATMQFVYEASTTGNKEYTITYDKAWFDNKEDNIKQAYAEFFISAVNANHVEFEIVYDADGVTPHHWLATMT